VINSLSLENVWADLDGCFLVESKSGFELGI
jgi:hypothetical protein